MTTTEQYLILALFLAALFGVLAIGAILAPYLEKWL